MCFHCSHAQIDTFACKLVREEIVRTDSKAKSEQESLLRILTEVSMSAQFIFKPMHSRKRGTETADLAWACNSCLILMWATRNKVYADKEKNKRVCQKAIEHNLKQAGWLLRNWRKGVDYLVGENSVNTFCLKYMSSTRIIVLSVIECGEAVAMLHPEAAQGLGVTCCATLPYSVIARLAAMHGTAVDLMVLLLTIQARGEIPEEAMLHHIEGYAAHSWFLSGAEAMWPGGRLDKRYWDAAGFLLATRASRPLEPCKIDMVYGLADLNDDLNDIRALDFYKVVLAVRNCMDRVEAAATDTPLAVSWHRVSVPAYDFCVCVARERSDATAHFFEQAVSEWQQDISTGAIRHGKLFLIECASKTSVAVDLTKKREGPSNIERLVDTFTEWPTAPPLGWPDAPSL